MKKFICLIHTIFRLKAESSRSSRRTVFMTRPKFSPRSFAPVRESVAGRERGETTQRR